MNHNLRLAGDLQPSTGLFQVGFDHVHLMSQPHTPLWDTVAVGVVCQMPHALFVCHTTKYRAVHGLILTGNLGNVIKLVPTNQNSD